MKAVYYFIIFLASLAMVSCVPSGGLGGKKENKLKLTDSEDDSSKTGFGGTTGGTTGGSADKVYTNFHDIIKNRCIGCHGAGSSSFEIKMVGGSVDLVHLEDELGMLKPGSAGESLIYQSILNNRMPKSSSLVIGEKITVFNYINSLPKNQEPDVGMDEPGMDEPGMDTDNPMPSNNGPKAIFYSLATNQSLDISEVTTSIQVSGPFSIVIEKGDSAADQVYFNFGSGIDQTENVLPFASCGDDGELISLKDCMSEKNLQAGSVYNLNIEVRSGGSVIKSFGPYFIDIQGQASGGGGGVAIPEPELMVSFAEALPILQRNCFGCHSSGGKKFNYETEAEIFGTSFFTPRDVNSHALVRTEGYSGQNPHGFTGAANMPTNETLSIEDFKKIESWIKNTAYIMPDMTPDEAKKFSCDPGESKNTLTGTRRLTRTEYINTLEYVLKKYLEISQYNEVRSLIQSDIEQIPADEGSIFTRNTNTVSQALAASYVYIARKVGEYIGATDARAKKFLGSCASAAGMDDTCLGNVLDGVGKTIYRRPLTTEEKGIIKTDVQSFEGNKTAWVVARLFASPNFFMLIEENGEQLSDDLYKVGPYELASRVSYHLTKNMPDDQLLNAAASGQLDSEAGLKTQVDRLLRLSETRESLKDFYREWLHLDGLETPDTNLTEGFSNFSRGDSVTKESLIQEIEDMTKYYTFDTDGKFKDLFTSDVSFAKGEDLADIYGVAPWSGNPDDLVRFPSGERAGIINRAALLVSGTRQTQPFTRGVRIREELLCDHLTPPPASVLLMARSPGLDHTRTTRERYTDLTSDQSCMGCHAQFNPLGFGLEDYDSMGRYQGAEKIYSDDGAFLSELTIDSHVSPNISAGDTRESFSAYELSHMIGNSVKAQQCFVKKYYTYTYRIEPETDKDGCTLEEMRSKLDGNAGSIRSMIRQSVLSNSFRLRRAQ